LLLPIVILILGNLELTTLEAPNQPDKGLKLVCTELDLSRRHGAFPFDDGLRQIAIAASSMPLGVS
jgi:hypothetical protein